MKDPDWYADPYGDLLKAWRHRLGDLRETWEGETYEDGRAAALSDCIDELAEVQARIALRRKEG
jgi:hypothetical protein